MADSKLLAVLHGLNDKERTLPLGWASTSESWNQAALGAGLPPEYGERVRRKLKRLGKQHEQRQANATAL
ncbi:hypothetical protein [Streptomyces sp. NPDC005231]|uniref:hypothetical protein n=1 Tax=Streptomyces sp. NPDC005231 TaxID=3157026 RepID=UPI0033A887FE